MLKACKIDFISALDSHLPLVEVSYNNNYYMSNKVAPLEAPYGRKCWCPICWTEVGDNQLAKKFAGDTLRPGLNIIHETTQKILQIWERIKATRGVRRASPTYGLNPWSSMSEIRWCSNYLLRKELYGLESRLNWIRGAYDHSKSLTR